MTLHVTIEGRLPPDLPALVESVTFGTAGLRYRRLGAAVQIARLNDPTFVVARRDGLLVGACVLDRRALLLDGKPTIGIYRGLLCVAPSALGQGIGRRLAAAARAGIETVARDTDSPLLSWGCIDADNHASLSLLASEGARDAGGLAMFMTYRQWPRERVRLHALADGREPREADALSASQGDCLVRDITPSRLPGLALVDDDGLRVSARVAVSGYRIESMGPALDALVRRGVLPFAPARRRFDPSAFRYVRFSDVTLRAGDEGAWSDFVSGVLARHDAHFGMTFVDPSSALHARLRRVGPFGRLVHGTDAPIRLMMRQAGKSTRPFDTAGPLSLAPVDG